MKDSLAAPRVNYFAIVSSIARADSERVRRLVAQRDKERAGERGLPSAADLDAVAAEEQARVLTGAAQYDGTFLQSLMDTTDRAILRTRGLTL